MATAILDGQTTWKMTRDEEGHRTYNITFRVRGATTDGPANVLQTPGLPVVGDIWEFDGDVDVWAWCRWNAEVNPVVEGEPNTEWTVAFVFSTKASKCCIENQVEDPLLQPMVVTGGSNKYTEEATQDRNGDDILNSALEQIRGPQNEWDANRSTVKIVQNVADLELNLCNSMQDTVNDSPLWGFEKRKVKLSSFTWEQKFYGLCNVYYVRHFEFDVNEKTWDRDILDEGSKALNGHHNPVTGAWTLDNINGAAPDPANPLHYKAYVDRAGNITRVILDGAGKPFVPTDPDSGADERWWAIITGDNGPFLNSIFQGTCSDAKNYARSQGGMLVLTSQASSAEAQEVADNSDFGDASMAYPQDVECADGSDGPGKIHVEKYQEKNFLLLALPTAI